MCERTSTMNAKVISTKWNFISELQQFKRKFEVSTVFCMTVASQISGAQGTTVGFVFVYLMIMVFYSKKYNTQYTRVVFVRMYESNCEIDLCLLPANFSASTHTHTV